MTPTTVLQILPPDVRLPANLPIKILGSEIPTLERAPISVEIRHYDTIYTGTVLKLNKTSAWVLFETKTAGAKVRRLPLVPGGFAVIVPLGHTADRLVRKHSAFTGMDDLLAAKGSYRPSISCHDGEHVLFANAYDVRQARRNDGRRAYRYGGAK